MTTLEMFEKLRQPAPDITLYNVLFRVAGVGLLWHEESRVKCQDCLKGTHRVGLPLDTPIRERVGKRICEGWREGLIVYRYYPTFKKAVCGEYKRRFGICGVLPKVDPVVYLASPLGFASGTHDYLVQVRLKLATRGYRVLDPWDQDNSQSFKNMEEQYSVTYRRDHARALARRIGQDNEKMLRQATHVLGVVDGMEPDSGTVSEMAFASGIGKRVYGLRTDLRDAGDFFGVPLNLQVMHWIEKSGGKLFRSIADIELA